MSEYMFHTVRRNEIAGGAKIELVLVGFDYTRDGKTTEPERIASVIVDPIFTEWDGRRVQLMESTEAASLVHEHVSPRHTVVWMGRAWHVEYAAPLFGFHG